MKEIFLKLQISQNDEVKYEHKRVDRVLDIPFPCAYGELVNSEIQEDGDPADGFLVSKRRLSRDCTVDLNDMKYVGRISYVDKNLKDDKYVFVLKSEYSGSQEFKRYLLYTIKRIESYLLCYKELKHKNKISEAFLDFELFGPEFKHLLENHYKPLDLQQKAF